MILDVRIRSHKAEMKACIQAVAGDKGDIDSVFNSNEFMESTADYEGDEIAIDLAFMRVARKQGFVW